MGITRTATIWYGVAEPLSEERVFPFATEDVDGERLEELGLHLVTFGRGTIEADLYGLCLLWHYRSIDDCLGPLLETFEAFQMGEFALDAEWLALLKAAQWIGPTRRSMHLGLWIW